MLKKRIKKAITLCVLVCMLPNISYCIDKENFVNLLINKSYPETKEEKEESEKDTKNDNKEANKEKDYIKFYVGEENIPQLDTETENENENEVASNKDYKNDLRITKENPSILIYHTHGTETYSNSPAGNYHSNDKPNSVIAVGELLSQKLTEKGWGVIHTTKYHDNDYNTSYATSLKTVQQLTNENSSVKIAVDLHRDARDVVDSNQKKTQHDKFMTTINGEKVAKFSFVVGEKNDNINELRALAEDITKFAEEKYPGITRPVVSKKYGKYNQFVAEQHMLIEVGSNVTSIQEAKASAKYIANILDEYFKQYK